jgi:PAS domain S-box-containing protein
MDLKALRTKQEFLDTLGTRAALELFEFLPDAYFWIKDREGRFVAANALFVQGCGLARESDLFGKTDLDVWPRHLAEAYRRDDRVVMKSGKPMINKMELSRNDRGGADWYCTTKVPLYDARGAVAGTAGFARDLKKGHSTFKPYMDLSPVMEHILAHYASNLSLKSLSAMVSMSPSKFERRFKSIFGRTPTAYIQGVRIQAACQLLAEGGLTISQVAHRTGHYDHSHFNRYFKKQMGQSPTRYRKTHAGQGG